MNGTWNRRARLMNSLLLAIFAGGLFPAVPARAQEQPVIVAEGQVEPVRWVQLSLPYGARVEAVHFKEGEKAAAGDVLVTLDGAEALQAAVAAAELEVVLAGQAIKDLEDRAGVELAQAEVSLAAAQDEYELRRDLLAGLERPRPQALIDQARANLLLAEEVLARMQEDLAKARQKFANKKSLIWHFINERDVRLSLAGMEAQVAYYERRTIDAREKLDDLLAPVDPVKLELARAAESQAAARLEQARRDRDELLNGPDQDKMAAAKARLDAGRAGLDAARAALDSVSLKAPQDGQVVMLVVQPGEWVAANTRIAVVADLAEWQVVSTDLTEDEVAGVQAGQPVQVTLDAFPDRPLAGTVESIALQATEEDGDVFYTVKINLEGAFEGMRWGMRAGLEF